MKRLALAASAIVGLMLIIAAMAGFFETKIDPTLESSPGTAFDPSRLAAAREVTITLAETVPATLAARDTTLVSSRILSRVERVPVRPGDIVSKGDILVALDDDDLTSRLAQAEGQLEAVTAQHEEARLRLERLGELQSRGLAAQADLDNARATFDALAARMSNAEQAVEEARIVLRYATVVAPISGRIVERLIEPGDTVTPGLPLLSLYDPGSIRVEAAVRERLALGLALGQTIDIEIPALERFLTGTIEEITPAADPSSRSFQVRAAIDVDPVLLPGMFARFHIPHRDETLIVIPERAVTRIGALDAVTVIEDGTARNRFVRIGRQLEDGNVAVMSGMAAGEEVVLPR